MDIMDIMKKKCSVCNNTNYNTNLYFMTYNKNPFRLYFHQECKYKLINFLDLIFKNQVLQLNMDELGYSDTISKYKYKYKFKSKNIIEPCDRSNDIYNQLSELITTKFLCFTKVYNIMELINLIQLNDPLYHILLIVSTWFDY